MACHLAYHLTLDASVNIPDLSDDAIEGYLTKHMGLDETKNSSQAMIKGRHLVESQRVEACSMLLKEKEAYISSICKAAMKKAVPLHACCWL